MHSKKPEKQNNLETKKILKIVKVIFENFAMLFFPDVL